MGDLPATREGVVRQLASDKWTLLREAAGKSGGARTLVLELAKGREQMQVTISELEAGLCAVAQTWVGSDRPDAVPNDGERRPSDRGAPNAERGLPPAVQK